MLIRIDEQPFFLRALVCKNQTNSKFRGKGEKFDFFDEQPFFLRALVCKNQTNSKLRDKGEKFDFFLILILDRLDYDLSHWILF